MLRCFCAFILFFSVIIGRNSLGCSDPDDKGILYVQSIKFADPKAHSDYVTEIDFLPVGDIYTGSLVALDTLKYLENRNLFYVESKLLIDVPEHCKTQQWSLGPWCKAREGFTYVVRKPKNGKICTILDEDGFLTRGLLSVLRKNSLLDDLPSLQQCALKTLLDNLDSHLDTICYQTCPEIFYKRKDFFNNDLMYYQRVNSNEDGLYTTVRIRPSNHSYKMEVVDWVRSVTYQAELLHDLIRKNNQLPTLIVRGEGVRSELEDVEPLSIFLDPSITENEDSKNYIPSTLIIRELNLGRCTFQWDIARSHGSSHEIRHVKVDARMSFRGHLGSKPLTQGILTFYKYGQEVPFLKIGPAYSLDNGLLDWTRSGENFFIKKVENILKPKRLSFLDYIDR